MATKTKNVKAKATKRSYRTFAKAVVIEFIVLGRGWFPMDMLRYDSCWPADSDALNRMTARADEYEDSKVFFAKLRSIKLRGVVEPRIERWNSMGWAVVTDDLSARRLMEKYANESAPLNIAAQ